MDHLKGIALFVRAAEAGSFAGAAKVAGVTPSAVSKAVSRLEERLSAPLFHRSTRSVRLTDDGKAFYERVRSGLDEIEAAEDLLLRRWDLPRGRLRVSMPVVFGHCMIAPLLPAFSRAYPELEVETHSTDRFTDIVEKGFDVLIRTGHLDDTALIARELVDTRFRTVASPDYLRRHGEPRSLQDLCEQACLAYRFPTTWRTFAWPFVVNGNGNGNGTSIVPTGGPAFTNADAMIAACEAGGGIMHLQDYILARSIREGRLLPILEQFESDGGPVSILYQPNRQPSPKVRVFVDFFARALAHNNQRSFSTP